MNIGVIGLGEMGSTFLEGLFSAGYQDIEVFAYNRTGKKTYALHEKFPGLTVSNTIEAVIDKSTILVLALPFSVIQGFPPPVVSALKEKKPLTIVFCGYVPMRLLQRHLMTKVVKAYPNINWAIGLGVTVLHFGFQFNQNEKTTIFDFLSRISDVYEISEDHFRPFSNLMSCGPALWIKMIDLFIKANVERYSIDYALAFEVTRKTIEGTFKLMKEKNCSSEELIRMVARPGGATEVGLNCFEQFLPEIFNNTIEQISSRDNSRIQKLAIE